MRADFLRADSPAWTEFLAGMPHDVYHLARYARFATRHQDPGEAWAFAAHEGDRRFFLPLIVRPVPGETTDLSDATGPHGYPGPLLATGATGDAEDFPARAIDRLISALRERGVVSAFIRLHPVLSPPVALLGRFGTVVEHGTTVVIDLTRPADELWRSTRENHRRDIERARRDGFVARIDEPWDRFDDFTDLYRQTMDRIGASSRWYLSRAYLADLRDALEGHIHLCVVEQGGDLAAAAIVMKVDGLVEYHLAATADRYVGSSPSKLLIDHVRSWAKDEGGRVLNLGGGMRPGDPLIRFKYGFSTLERPVHTWRVVADVAAYDALMERWRQRHRADANPLDADAGAADGFFPGYRRP